MNKSPKISARSRGERLTSAGYAKMLAAVVFGGATWREMAAAVDCERSSAQHIARGMHKQGLTHIAEWIVPEGKTARSRAPRYEFGPGVDAQWPAGDFPIRKPYRTRPDMIAFAECVKELMLAGHHGKGLAEVIGIDARAARGIIKGLHAAKLVHIMAYEIRDAAGAGAPIYTWAPGEKDEPKPKAMTQAQLNRRWAKIHSDRARHLKTLRALQGHHVDRRRAAPSANRELEAA